MNRCVADVKSMSMSMNQNWTNNSSIPSTSLRWNYKKHRDDKQYDKLYRQYPNSTTTSTVMKMLSLCLCLWIKTEQTTPPFLAPHRDGTTRTTEMTNSKTSCTVSIPAVPQETQRWKLSQRWQAVQTEAQQYNKKHRDENYNRDDNLYRQ